MAPADETDPLDVDDHWRFELRLAIILVCPRELGDCQWLISVLTGTLQPEPMETCQLHRLLTCVVENWWHWFARTAPVRRRIAKKIASHHAELGVLDETEMAQLESSINHKLVELLRSAGP